MRRIGLIVALVAMPATAGGAWAQETTPGRLIAGARAQLEAPNFDSAAILLGAALDPSRGATRDEQARAWTLYAIVQLTLENTSSARDAIRQALTRDGQLRVDSLGFFHDALVREFEALRTEMGLRAAVATALAVQLDGPGDTVVPASGGRYRITTTPTYPARVAVQVTPADAPAALIWADTQLVRGVGTVGWELRGRDGALVAPGRYAVRASAIDSNNVASSIVQRVVLVERVAVDTQLVPEPLTQAAFLPETLILKRGSPMVLVGGLALGAAAAMLPSALGNTELSSSTTTSGAYAVAGVVSLAGIVGYFSGARVRPLPENAARNAATRTQHEVQVQEVQRNNARAREAAPVRVRLEGTGP